MTNRQVLAGAAAVTVVKLILAASWGWTNDIPQTLAQAQAFLNSPHVLRPSGPSIFPLGYYLLATAPLVASMWTGLSYAFWIKVPAILADLVIALVLRAMPRGGDRAAWLYLLNPVTVLLSVYHGQLHTAATAGLVIALWYAENRRAMESGVALGLAASVRQHFGCLILPFLLAVKDRKHRAALLGGFSLVVLLSNVTLWNGWYQGRLASPVWAYGHWGYPMVLLQGPRVLALLGGPSLTAFTDALRQLFDAYGPAVYWAWAAVFWISEWRRHHAHQERAPASSALLFLVGVYVVGPGFGVQWLVWALPCWLLVDRRGAVIYSTLAGLFLAGSCWQWGLNAKYGVESITAHLPLLSRADLIGVLLVGVCGLSTWVYCIRMTWRLAWGR